MTNTDKTEAPELKPCPFCAWEDTEEIDRHQVCMRCGARGPRIPLYVDDKAWTWNTRTDACEEVKPLKFTPLRNGVDWRCYSLFGQYQICQNDDLSYRVGYMPHDRQTGVIISDSETLGNCEILAQSHHADEMTEVITTRPASEVHQEGYDAGKAAGRAEALEEAATCCTNIIKNYDVMKPDGVTYEPLKVQKAAKGMVSLVREDIRALNKEAGE